MSLLEFQRALADLTASPALCREAVHSPETVLNCYELTEREHARLATMVCDRLMSTNCALYRANRITPLFMFFPMTCRLLGQDLRRELDAFWCADRAIDLQYRQETARFTRFLKKRRELGFLRSPYLEEIVDYETAMMELRFATGAQEPQSRLVHFCHHPFRLLSSLEKAEPIPEDLENGQYCVWLEARGDILEVRAGA
jgi:hypothetical protein